MTVSHAHRNPVTDVTPKGQWWVAVAMGATAVRFSMGVRLQAAELGVRATDVNQQPGSGGRTPLRVVAAGMLPSGASRRFSARSSAQRGLPTPVRMRLRM